MDTRTDRVDIISHKMLKAPRLRRLKRKRSHHRARSFSPTDHSSSHSFSFFKPFESSEDHKNWAGLLDERISEQHEEDTTWDKIATPLPALQETVVKGHYVVKRLYTSLYKICDEFQSAGKELKTLSNKERDSKYARIMHDRMEELAIPVLIVTRSIDIIASSLQLFGNQVRKVVAVPFEVIYRQNDKAIKEIEEEYTNYKAEYAKIKNPIDKMRDQCHLKWNALKAMCEDEGEFTDEELSDSFTDVVQSFEELEECVSIANDSDEMNQCRKTYKQIKIDLENLEKERLFSMKTLLGKYSVLFRELIEPFQELSTDLSTGIESFDVYKILQEFNDAELDVFGYSEDFFNVQEIHCHPIPVDLPASVETVEDLRLSSIAQFRSLMKQSTDVLMTSSNFSQKGIRFEKETEDQLVEESKYLEFLQVVSVFDGEEFEATNSVSYDFGSFRYIKKNTNVLLIYEGANHPDFNPPRSSFVAIDERNTWLLVRHTAFPRSPPSWIPSSYTSPLIINQYITCDALTCVPFGARLFREHLKIENSEEHFAFLEEAQGYKDLFNEDEQESQYESKEIETECARIIKTFVVDNGPRPINISHRIRQTILKSFENADMYEIIFDNAMKDVFRMLSADSYPRFIKTGSFRYFLKKCGQSWQ